MTDSPGAGGLTCLATEEGADADEAGVAGAAARGRVVVRGWAEVAAAAWVVVWVLEKSPLAQVWNRLSLKRRFRCRRLRPRLSIKMTN